MGTRYDGPASGVLLLTSDPAGLAPGVYTFRATAGGETATTRLAVTR